jgi:hypothetical protein
MSDIASFSFRQEAEWFQQDHLYVFISSIGGRSESRRPTAGLLHGSSALLLTEPFVDCAWPESPRLPDF